MDNIFKKISKIISEKFGVPDEEIHLNSDLTSDLNLTNIEINDLLGLIAKEFNFVIPLENDIENLSKISDLIEIVENYAEVI